MRWAWGALLLVACGGGDDASIFGYRSGSRLRAHVYDGDGVRLLIDFRDTQLNLNCSFARAEDGQWRCLPGTSAEIAFTDAQCTQPAFQNLDTCNAPPPTHATYVRPPASGYCGFPLPTENAVTYTVGQQLPAGPVFTLAIDGCYMSSSSASNLYAVTRVDPAMFALGTEAHVAHGSLLTHLIEGQDGSRFVAGIENAQKLDCHQIPYDTSPSESVRCVTGRLIFADPAFYGDAQCSMALGYEYASCDPPDLIWHTMVPPCGPTPWGMFGPGAPVDPSMVRTGSATSCNPYTGTNLRFFAPGSAVAIDSFPEMRSSTVGSGALVVYQRTNAAGDALGLPASRLVLRQLAVECTPTPAADGTLRCDAFPRVREGDADYYMDAACTQGVIDARTTCGKPPPAFGVHTKYTGTICIPELIQSTFDLGPVVQPAAVFLKTATGCQPAILDTEAEYHQVGAAGDLSRLPLVKELVE